MSRAPRLLAALIGLSALLMAARAGQAAWEDETSSAPAPAGGTRIEVHDLQQPQAGSSSRGPSSLRDIENSISQARRDMERLERDKSELSQQLAKAQGDLAAARAEAQATQAKLMNEADGLRASLRAAEDGSAKLTKSVESLERERATLTSRLSQVESDLAAAKMETQAKIGRAHV